MCNYLEETYNNILKSIKENIIIKDIDDYNVYDATFITQHFKHGAFFNNKMILGIFRVGVNSMGFYSAPYFHIKNTQRDYEPMYEVVPQKKSLLQHIKLKASPKPKYRLINKYEPTLYIDKIITEKVAEQIPLPSHYLIFENLEGESLWDVFLLDNLKYILPGFGTGIYKRRTFITNRQQLLSLPAPVRQKVLKLKIDITPQIICYNNSITFQIFYFNEWKGLVLLGTSYHISCESTHNIKVKKLKYHLEEQSILVEYQCNTRY